MDQQRARSVDPARTLRLLWRHELPAPARRRGPRPRVGIDDVVAHAIDRADAHGLEALTVRALAADLGLSRMALYGYIVDQDELIELMVEQVNEELLVELRARLADVGSSWRERLRVVAAAEWAACRRHPWLLDVGHDRPVLGPASIGVYEAELATVDGWGLSDLELDRVRWQLINFVRGIARDERDAAAIATRTGETSLDWWQARADVLARLVTVERFPLATRVGTAAGEADQSAYDPGSSFGFGLERLFDGIGVLINERSG